MMASVRRTGWTALAVLLGATALSAVPTPAEAQYFGRNRVVYRTFDFRVLRTTHFDVYYYPEEEQAARDGARMAERWYSRLSRILDYEFENRQVLIFYASSPHFQQTTTTGSDIGEGTGGFTEPLKQRVVMPFAASYEETDHVVGHELVHAFQYDISGVGRAGANLPQASQRLAVPLWFIEGMAEYLSIGPVDPHTSMWLRDAALSGNLPTLRQLTNDPRYFPYRWGQAFWAYVGGRWGDAAVGQILKQVGQGVPYPDAFQRILNTGLEEIVEDWQTSIRRTYLPLLTERREAREVGRPLLTSEGRGGQVNIGPALSPDGSRIVFLSELDFLDIELFLADAETGRVIRRLVKGAAFDPHFASLRFINSSGTWAADNRRFALTAQRGDRDVLAILDTETGRILREYTVDGVSELSNPTWSPDGATVVVAGNRGGIHDLYAITLADGATRQLTDDRFADLHPAFSPDGRTIAFVSDRGTDFETLVYGRYQLALFDLATGRVTPLEGTGRGKDINPQWTADGTGLFFISDRAGISNVYRLALQTGAVTQVTNLFTGVSGYTDLSPAIASAARADRLVFTAYEDNGFNLYSLTGPTELAGTEPVPVQFAASEVPLPALLPPSPRPAEPAFNRVSAVLADVTTGLPAREAQEQWAVVPYRPRISLDYVGQPSVGVSVSSGPYGRGGLYGGISGIFSDQLGYHTVYGVVQAQGQLDEIGFSAVYLNQKYRWNYGFAAQRVPYLYGGRVTRADSTAQDGVIIRDGIAIERLFDNAVLGIAQYPFSRVQRVEFQAGIRRYARDIQFREYIYAVQDDNSIIGPIDYREEKESLDGYTLGEASAALVYDNSLSGYTSPFAGQRYRLEVAPSFGDIEYTALTADYRRYFFLRPVTLAVRAYHYGRYGRDEGLFNEIFLGYPSLIRGYSYGSVEDACFEEAGNGPLTGDECRTFDALYGSRIGVANVELRVPLINQLTGGLRGGLPPVEGFAFLDAGAAWGSTRTFSGARVDTDLVFERGLQDDPSKRGILTSAGVGARINLFGFVIVETSYVNALDRPRGWHWQFALQPGF